MDFKPIYPFTINQGMKRLNAGMAIMPSKYTDEIENSSYMLGGYFL